MLFVKEGKWGWQIGLKATDKDKKPIKDGAGNDVYCNMRVCFSKGQEPKMEELDKYNTYNGDLYFKDTNNRFRKCALLPNVYQDNNGRLVKEIKLYMGDWQFDVEPPKTTKPIDPQGNEINEQQKLTFEPDGLPFY